MQNPTPCCASAPAAYRARIEGAIFGFLAGLAYAAWLYSTHAPNIGG
jgi:membrane associated rhomboid family serine protease